MDSLTKRKFRLLCVELVHINTLGCRLYMIWKDYNDVHDISFYRVMICVTDLCKVYLVCGKVILFLIKNDFNRINELDADLLSQPNAIIFKTCVL